MVKHWNRLPREAVKTTSPETLKTSLDTVWIVEDIPGHCREVGLDDL